ncbi:hypothetical protein [Streptomyces sp. NPDC060322]|uniref:hypothetical protein n=1 Tax=Streptomyces sp. NPDC060322 TaxID=3347097 RepID=UPI0036462FAC
MTGNVAAHGVRACQVVEAGRVGGCQFQEDGGQVGDVYRAPHDLAEQGAVARASGEVVDELLVECTSMTALDEP